MHRLETSMDSRIASSSVGTIHDIVMDQSTGMEELERGDRFEDGTIWFGSRDRHRTDGAKERAKAFSAIDEEVAHGS